MARSAGGSELAPSTTRSICRSRPSATASRCCTRQSCSSGRIVASGCTSGPARRHCGLWDAHQQRRLLRLRQAAAAEFLGSAFPVAAVIGWGAAASRLPRATSGCSCWSCVATGSVLVALILRLRAVPSSNPVITLLERALGTLTTRVTGRPDPQIWLGVPPRIRTIWPGCRGSQGGGRCSRRVP